MELDGREVRREPESRLGIPGLPKGVKVIGSSLCAGQ